MRRNGWLRTLALGALVAVFAFGCGGGKKDSAGSAPAGHEVLDHADAVVVTYYYLPG